MKHKLIVFGFFIILAGCKSDIFRLDKVVNQLDKAEIISIVPSNQKLGMSWLLNNMDADDKNLLNASFLKNNCNYAL